LEDHRELAAGVCEACGFVLYPEPEQLLKTHGYVWMSLVIGCVSLIVAGLGVRATVSTFVAWRSLDTWLAKEARIERAQMEMRESEDGAEYPVLDVKYSYVVDDTSYTSTRIFFNDGTDARERTVGQQLIALREADTPTTCYVNPDDHADAVLHRQLSLEGLVELFIWVLLSGLFSCMLAVAVHFLRRRRRLLAGAPGAALALGRPLARRPLGVLRAATDEHGGSSHEKRPGDGSVGRAARKAAGAGEHGGLSHEKACHQ
jgi:hypothetical protein